MPQLRQFDGVLLKKVRIGRAVLGPRPAIVLTVTDRETPGQIQKIKNLVQGKRRFPLLLEVRIDRFRHLERRFVLVRHSENSGDLSTLAVSAESLETRPSPETAPALTARTDFSDAALERVTALKKLRIPLIATVRAQKEGGAFFLSNAARQALYRTLLPHVDAIDIELASRRLIRSLVPLAHRQGKRVILSYHHFSRTPPDAQIKHLIEKGKREGADLVKIAVTPQKKSDIGRLLLLTYRHREKGVIAIAMGRRGASSRFLAPFFGSLLTYSFVGRSQAPGQIPVRQLLKKIHPLFSPFKPWRKT